MTRMTFDEAVDFIVGRLDVPPHERRATRDKVRKRVRGGLGDGKLPRLDLATTDVGSDQLIYWARTKWPGKFNIPVSVPANAADTMSIAGSADAMTLPSTIEQCHASIRKLFADNRMLAMIAQRQASIISELRPLADQYERNREKNREAAKKPRS